MSEGFLGEIRLFGFNFAPRNWALCDGQILPINQNQSLYALLGTIYGGDGRTSFALPDLRGRVPISPDAGIPTGGKGGEEAVSLTAAQIPAHVHSLNASSDTATANAPTGQVLAASTGANLYGPPLSLAAMSPNSITQAGGGQAHDNMQPYLAVNFCICLYGLFPSRN